MNKNFVDVIYGEESGVDLTRRPDNNDKLSCNCLQNNKMINIFTALVFCQINIQ